MSETKNPTQRLIESLDCVGQNLHDIPLNSLPKRLEGIRGVYIIDNRWREKCRVIKFTYPWIRINKDDGKVYLLFSGRPFLGELDEDAVLVELCGSNPIFNLFKQIADFWSECLFHVLNPRLPFRPRSGITVQQIGQIKVTNDEQLEDER